MNMEIKGKISKSNQSDLTVNNYYKKMKRGFYLQ